MLMVAFYGPLAYVIASEAGAATIGGRSLFYSLTERFMKRGGSYGIPAVPKRVPGRTLASYLLLPRPGDLVKWTIAPGAYLAAVVSTGDVAGWPNFLFMWLILEYLLYSARYQWNDLRGWGDDLLHTERLARARLPRPGSEQGAERIAAASAAVAMVRIGAALVLGLLSGQVWQVVAMAVSIFGVAAGYEWLRARAAAGGGRAIVVMIWVVVGLGYPIRASVGLGVGGIGVMAPAFAVGLVYFAALGVMFVLLTWALDATSYCVVGPAGKFCPDPDKAIDRKPHLAHLLPYLEPLTAPGDDAFVNQQAGRLPLLSHRRARWAPWNFAFCCAAVAGNALGVLLVYGPTRPSAWIATYVVVVLGIAGMVESGGNVGRLVTYLLTAGALMFVFVLVGRWQSVLLPLPWIVTGLLYISFRSGSYHDLMHAMGNAAQGLRQFARVAVGLLVGRRTLEHLRKLDDLPDES